MKEGETLGVKAVRADLTGKKFDRLTVIEFAGVNKHGQSMWLCKCDCGNFTEPVMISTLTSGRKKSCGCLRKEISSKANKKHGMAHSRLYIVWQEMKTRCYNQKRHNFKNYGGRGIAVCDEWKNSFVAFYEWAMSNGYDETAKYGDCTLDRIDVNGNYCPNNCRWATIKEQNNNKRKHGECVQATAT